MSTPRIRTRSRTAIRAAVAVAIASVLALGSVALGTNPAPAQAAARVEISGTAESGGSSTLQLSGSGFQSVQGGFGGIYVLFGWVDNPAGGWQPSQGGVTGSNFRYVSDDETNPIGYQLFVSFPGSSTEYAANGGEVAADGTWSGTIIVPGSTLQTVDRQMTPTTVDCLAVTCGIITIGAHGVKNANNETFTPVSFAQPAAANSGGGAGAAAAGPAAASPGATIAPTSGAAAPAPAAGAAAASPAPAAPSTGMDANLSWLMALLPVILFLGFSILALAAGVGAYLAAKSLILGVNPAALEKVRGQRERRAVIERERQRRRTATLARKQELRSAAVRRRAGADAARPLIARMPADDPSSSTTSPAPLLDFFTGSGAAPRSAVDADGGFSDRPLTAVDDSPITPASHSDADETPTALLAAPGSRPGGDPFAELPEGDHR